MEADLQDPEFSFLSNVMPETAEEAKTLQPTLQVRLLRVSWYQLDTWKGPSLRVSHCGSFSPGVSESKSMTRCSLAVLPLIRLTRRQPDAHASLLNPCVLGCTEHRRRKATGAAG